MPNHYLWVYEDKTLLYMVKLTAKLSCGMDFTDYPHDTQVSSIRVIIVMISAILQVCFIMIESLSHTTEDLIFKWNFTELLFINPEINWKIYHPVNRLRSFLSSCHPVIWSLGHLVTWSLSYSVT